MKAALDFHLTINSLKLTAIEFGGSMLRTFFITVALITCSSAVSAQHLDSYRARLSEKDHYNSSGTALNSAAAIIRQDRANFYVFGHMDPEDEADTFFNNKTNRARLEKMLTRGNLSDDDLNSIINSTPVIRVDIHQDHVEVTVETP